MIDNDDYQDILSPVLKIIDELEARFNFEEKIVFELYKRIFFKGEHCDE